MGTVTGMVTTMTEPTDMPLADPALHRLLAWLSPAFPVGAFTWSHGLEAAVEAGLVHDRDSLMDWVGWIVAQGSGRLDADCLRESHRAVAARDWAALRESAEEAAAQRATAEMALEASAQGAAFLRAITDGWPAEGIAKARAVLTDAGLDVAYPVAVGLAAACHGLPLRPVLAGYLHALGANLISAGVRLIPLGQTAGQQAQAALVPVFIQATEAALVRPWSDRGSAAPMVDWTSMAHETQYTRLFRS
nr:urease accessory UreF family protein [Roseospira navarrensis]